MSVRIGFLGGGLIAHHHGKMLHTSGADAAIVAVWDPDPGRAATFAERSGARVARSEDEVFEGTDAVYVCTWTAEHERLVARAADAGLAVFCEKPLAVDLAGAQRMVEAVGVAGVTNQVGLVLRDSPSFRLLRALVADEASGRLMSVVFRDDQYLPVQGMYGSTWRGEVDKCGHGTLLEHSIHDLDLLEWLFGPVTTVAACTREFHGLEGIEDLAVTTLAFDGGAVGTLTSVWHDVLARPSLRRVEVFCERAHYVLEHDFLGPVRWTTDAAEGEVEGQALLDALAARAIAPRNPDAAFVEAVIGARPASPDFAAALRPHLLCDAAYRSADAGGAPVDVAAGLASPPG